jgi:flagellar hook-associated protein 3 FlgL
VPYSADAAIEIEGVSVSVMGAPANGDGFEIGPSAPSLSIFNTLDRVIGALATPARTRAQIAQGNLLALRDIDSSMARVSSVRARIGETLNRTDGVADRLEATKLAASTERAAAEDLDMVHAISDFSAKQTGYDAALKTYSMVQRLSLFEYLR